MWFFGKKKNKKDEEKKEIVSQPATEHAHAETIKQSSETKKITKTQKSVEKEEKGTKKAPSKPATAKPAIEKTTKTARPSTKSETKKATTEKSNTNKVVAKKAQQNGIQKTQKTLAKDEQKADTTKKALYRVLFDKGSRLWLIKKDGAKRTIASFATKEEALSRVKELSSSNDLNFIVHKKDGKFQKKQ